MKKGQAAKKNYLGILFPEEKIGDYEIRPWTLEQTTLATPFVTKIVRRLSKWVEDNRERFPDGISKITEKDILEGLDEILPEIMVFAKDVISITLGITPEEANKKDGAEMTYLYFRVLAINVGYFESFFGAVLGRVVR